ncbi:MAG: FAD-binding monooxygenase [Nitrospirales bacterium]|nr:MAG: FAD-binding monooxygenase [Nitrospirales bacterium]
MPFSERKSDMTLDSPKQRTHAVVIGCSLAGLFTARVLSDHFERVTILERDPVGDHPESRRGQPQTRHLHGLLAQGFCIIKDLFPNLEDALVKGGAIISDMGEAIRWYHFDGYKKQFTSGLHAVSVSRIFLEWNIRHYVSRLPNVTVQSACPVRGLMTNNDRTQVLGVHVVTGNDGADETTIDADLVVDAAGRGSSAGKWLEHLGYDRPPEDEVKVGVGYATRLYRRRENDLVGAKLVMISPTPPTQKHMSFLFPVEHDRWIVAAGGWLGDHPSTDESKYLEFIRRLPVSDVYDVVSRAEPLSDVFTYKFPSSLRRRYENLTRFPEGYLVLGDAIASFNPIYGQGMTSAAMQVQALDSLLRQQATLTGLWRPFFQQIAKVVDIPWQMAACEDFRYPETVGKKPAMTDLTNAYLAKVHRATQHDSVVYAQFLKVMNLMAPPTSLMHPKIVWRVLRGRSE